MEVAGILLTLVLIPDGNCSEMYVYAANVGRGWNIPLKFSVNSPCIVCAADMNDTSNSAGFWGVLFSIFKD